MSNLFTDVLDACYPVSHKEAQEILQRFFDGHFNNKGPGPRISIPARIDYDDDLRLHAYIRQQAARDLKGAQ